jgi:hypothetical protein
VLRMKGAGSMHMSDDLHDFGRFNRQIDDRFLNMMDDMLTVHMIYCRRDEYGSSLYYAFMAESECAYSPLVVPSHALS